MTAPSAATLPRADAIAVSWRPAAVLSAVAALFERRATDERTSTAEWLGLFAMIVIATWLRFWGLGGHGLEYDEETMAMPVMHIIEHGTPAMPSGMIYARGVGQLYLMAASVVTFGPTEWALRLPSVLCGVLLIFGSFFLGRRFLLPLWNGVFVGVIALSSTMILDAQEARMYVFMVTALVWSNVLVFRWERTGQITALCGAVLALLIGVQFHSLAIFGAMPLLFPGLVQGDRNRLLQGGVALAISLGGFFLIHHWVEGFFPPHQPHPASAVSERPQPHIYAGIALQFWPLTLVAIAAIGVCCERLRRSLEDRGAGWPVFVSMSAALMAQLLVLYHVAALLYAVALVIALRAKPRLSTLLPIAALAIVMLGAHAYVLQSLHPDSLYKLVGRLTGIPSVWPYFIFANYAPVAAVIVVAGAVWAGWQLSRRRRIDAMWLYAALAVWAPLLLIGAFTWYTQQRYTEVALVPLYLCAVAILASCVHALTRTARARTALAIIAGLVIVDPLATANVVNAGYRIHPDHKGAAEYVANVRERGDILLAEDVLQQTYYLGRVDYWLIGERTANAFTRDFSGRRLDIYTHTPVMTTAEQLEALIARPARGAIYIIGSGEGQGDGRRLARGPSLAPLLERSHWPVVYDGRDGVTKVWRIPPPAAPVAVAP